MSDDTSPQWRAGRWLRDHADSWVAWRSSQESLRRQRLVTMTAAVSSVAHRALLTPSADEIVTRYPDILASCDRLAFKSDAETVAYLIWHLSDRYGRVLQVLDRLFAAGHLPLRRSRLSVLEVGAGPAPVLFAVRDFYDDLRAFITTSDLGIEAASARILHAIDRGPAWSWLLHRFSEELCARQGPDTDGSALPFGITYDDLEGLSVRREHEAAIDRGAEAILAEFERSDDDITRHTARRFAIEDGNYPPSAYDLIVMCNFLTNTHITEKFATEIELLSTALSAGGLLVVIGAAGGHYPAVYTRLDAILSQTRLRPLNDFPHPIQAHADEGQRNLIGAQIRGDVAFSSALAPAAFATTQHRLPEDITNLGQPIEFPQFQVRAWKNEWQRRTSWRS
ncbi:hypothetical protein ACIA5D_51255 [Actinoplanes sp. NPDC051513]|uniref:hypothetical protein n=1 Tax=Actinoplanes sp. NPDC051513 TaxID=3363908 RepID=UPI00379E09A8